MKCNKTECLHHKVCQEWVILGNDNYINDSDGYCDLYQSFYKLGKWIVDGSVDCYLDKVRCHCSKCGKKKKFPADYDHIKQELSISYKYPEFIDNFCSNCGAKMESEG